MRNCFCSAIKVGLKRTERIVTNNNVDLRLYKRESRLYISPVRVFGNSGSQGIMRIHRTTGVALLLNIEWCNAR